MPTSIAIYLLIDRRERFAGALTKGHQPRRRAAGGRTDFSGATLIAQAAGFGRVAKALVAVSVAVNLRTELHPLWLIAAGAALGLLAFI